MFIMRKDIVKRIISAEKRNDTVVASYTENNFPCIILAGIQPIYLITLRVNLAIMPIGNVLAIGRGDYCDLRTPKALEQISRLHCYIEKCNDGSFQVHDVSKFGTKVQANPQSQTFRDRLFHMFAAL